MQKNKYPGNNQKSKKIENRIHQKPKTDRKAECMHARVTCYCNIYIPASLVSLYYCQYIIIYPGIYRRLTMDIYTKSQAIYLEHNTCNTD